MQISLQQVIPNFFNQDQFVSSQIWGKQIDFTSHQHIHIIAPSGSGKTSLIHFLYGLRNDYKGEISYSTKNIKHFSIEDFSLWRQQHISVVFQDLRIFPEQTVFQNLEIKRVLSPYHSVDKITEMAKRLGIESKLQKLCKTCSYGEQQRIAIIRSLLQPFDFILLDEPFSHLDENNRKIAMQLIEEEAAARKASIILADLKLIEYFNANTVIYL
jgi:ABC-type lipoprotein export system ATPase subunit